MPEHHRPVVADTPPIQYLYQTGLIDLLPALYGHILLPDAVAVELSEGRSLGIPLPDPTAYGWMEARSAIPSMLDLIAANLGSGEREALALALELPDALLLTDDALARNQAHRLRISFTGTLGVLIRAKMSGHVPAIRPILDHLDELRFRLHPATRAGVLALAGEEEGDVR